MMIYGQETSRALLSVRVFHKRTKLAMSALLQTLYFLIFAVSCFVGTLYCLKMLNYISMDMRESHFKVVYIIGMVLF